jgi:hypothetical protein
MVSIARAMTAEEGRRMECAAHRLSADASISIQEAFRQLSLFTLHPEQQKREILRRARRRQE